MARFPMLLLLHLSLQDPTLGGPKTTHGLPCATPSPSSRGPFTLLSTLIVAPLLLKLSLVDFIGVWFFSSMLFALGVTAAFIVLPMAPPAFERLATNGFAFSISALVALGKSGVLPLLPILHVAPCSDATCILSLGHPVIYIPLAKLIRSH